MKLDSAQLAALLLRQWWLRGTMVDVVVGGGWRWEDPDLPPFMPRDISAYYSRKRRREVRQYVAAAWPGLSDWLWRRRDVAELVPAIDQVQLLRPPQPQAERLKNIFVNDAELAATAKDYKASCGYMAIRQAQWQQMTAGPRIRRAKPGR